MKRKKSVFITGSEGFIGSHLTEQLIKKGYKVKALVLYNSFNNIGNLEYLDKKLLSDCEILFGDIRDYNLIKQYSKNVDYIIHLAALIGIPYSYSAIESYIDVNIKGTQNLLRASLENQIDYFIHTSTSEVYGTAQYVPIDEKHPLVGQSPYSATKIAADNLVVSFNKSFNQNNLILRPFNTFGPRQSTRAVIPSIILQALNSNKLYLGKIDTTRDFTYVDDTVSAFLKAMKSPKAFNGQILNLGTGEDFSIKEVISIVSKYLNKKLIVKEEKLRIRPKKSEVLKLISNNKLAQKKINWKPDYSKRKGFERGIISTIEWFKKNKAIETSFSKFSY